jgi:hypothetical protein
MAKIDAIRQKDKGVLPHILLSIILAKPLVLIMIVSISYVFFAVFIFVLSKPMIKKETNTYYKLFKASKIN